MRLLPSVKPFTNLHLSLILFLYIKIVWVVRDLTLYHRKHFKNGMQILFCSLLWSLYTWNSNQCKDKCKYQTEGNSAIIMILLDQATIVEHEIPNWGTRAKIRIRPGKTKPVEYKIPNWGTSTKIRVRPDKKHQLM